MTRTLLGLLVAFSVGFFITGCGGSTTPTVVEPDQTMTEQEEEDYEAEMESGYESDNPDEQ